MTDDIFDVAVVGYGPVGMVLAGLLGKSGHRVVVLERYPGKYNLPRAATFDDETMRTLAILGIADELLPKLGVQNSYEWCNAAGDLLMKQRFADVGRSGWAEWYMMYQPDLEDALDDVCRSLPNVDVRLNSEVTDLKQDAAGVELRLASEPGPIRARYVVGCDGGNSFVRRALTVPVTDYGFSEPWMVCDFRLTGEATLPMARQVGDPNQPTSIISLGPDHHRFSFMLESEASFETESDADRVWGRVSRYLQPHQAELIRVATYTFRSLIVQQWQVGRVLLAGDAAHQMPPFLGQGMCSGIRDALNLWQKLDLVLTGSHRDEILAAYQTEREPHVRAVTLKGIELGRVQTTRDPAAAAERDRHLLANQRLNSVPDKFVFPPLGPGMLSNSPAAGELFVQGRVRVDGRLDRFDAVIGYGAALIYDAAVADGISAAIASAEGQGVRCFKVSHGASNAQDDSDVDGTYGKWLNDHDCSVVAVRPDFHVWGTGHGTDTAPEMIASFVEALGSRQLA